MESTFSQLQQARVSPHLSDVKVKLMRQLTASGIEITLMVRVLFSARQAIQSLLAPQTQQMLRSP